MIIVCTGRQLAVLQLAFEHVYAGHDLLPCASLRHADDSFELHVCQHRRRSSQRWYVQIHPVYSSKPSLISVIRHWHMLSYWRRERLAMSASMDARRRHGGIPQQRRHRGINQLGVSAIRTNRLRSRCVPPQSANCLC